MGCPLSTQAPDIQQVLAQPQLVLHIIDAGTQHPEQPAVYQYRRFAVGLFGFDDRGQGGCRLKHAVA